MVRKRATTETSQLAQLSATLRAAGLRRTGPRVAVLQQLALAKGPVSHGALADELAHLGFDRATIYRNLMDLTEAKLVSRYDLGDHVWRFELRRGDRNRRKIHPHLVCSDCGTVSCLPEAEVKIVLMRGASQRLRTQELEVQLRGVCDRCA